MFTQLRENHHFVMRKLTVAMAIFNSYVTNYQRAFQNYNDDAQNSQTMGLWGKLFSDTPLLDWIWGSVFGTVYTVNLGKFFQDPGQILASSDAEWIDSIPFLTVTCITSWGFQQPLTSLVRWFGVSWLRVETHWVRTWNKLKLVL